LTALGHDADGKCRANWLTDDAANARLHLFANHVRGYGPEHKQQISPEDFVRFAPCGWHWCQEKARIGESQWKDLSEALQILQNKGIDPNGMELAKLAEEYALSADWRKMWQKDPRFRAAAATDRRYLDPQYLKWVDAAEHAGAARSD